MASPSRTVTRSTPTCSRSCARASRSPPATRGPCPQELGPEEAHRHALDGRTTRKERQMLKLPRSIPLALALGLATVASAQQTRPTIVLVHGAFAESSGWDGVIAELATEGYRAIAAPNPLRSVASDAASVAALVGSIDGPVVLVGHSYGGPVITQAAIGQPNVVALVYVAGFAPDVGESSLTLSAMFPGSTLGDALQPVPLADGGQDLFIQRERFHAQFAAD